MHTKNTRHCRKCDCHLSYDAFDTFIQQTGNRAGRLCRHSYCRSCREQVVRDREEARRLPENIAVRCQCGCGQLTPVASKTYAARGITRGEPISYIRGHQFLDPQDVCDVDEVSGCWIWNKARNASGYGITRNGLAHRVFYTIRVGPIPHGHVLHHKCQNRACVNPEHMEPQEVGEHISRHKTPAPRGSDGRFIRDTVMQEE